LKQREIDLAARSQAKALCLGDDRPEPPPDQGAAPKATDRQDFRAPAARSQGRAARSRPADATRSVGAPPGERSARALRGGVAEQPSFDARARVREEQVRASCARRRQLVARGGAQTVCRRHLRGANRQLYPSTVCSGIQGDAIVPVRMVRHVRCSRSGPPRMARGARAPTKELR
jgi:hypothetical protein